MSLQPAVQHCRHCCFPQSRCRRLFVRDLWIFRDSFRSWPCLAFSKTNYRFVPCRTTIWFYSATSLLSTWSLPAPACICRDSVVDRHHLASNGTFQRNPDPSNFPHLTHSLCSLIRKVVWPHVSPSRWEVTCFWIKEQALAPEILHSSHQLRVKRSRQIGRGSSFCFSLASNKMMLSLIGPIGLFLGRFGVRTLMKVHAVSTSMLSLHFTHLGFWTAPDATTYHQAILWSTTSTT